MQSIGPWRGLAQNRGMSDDKSARVLIRRPPRGQSDAHGRATAASAELELVSTQMLKQILSSNDAENRKAVGEAAKTTGDGVLARDPATGYFEIIDEDELQAIVDSGQDLPKLSRPADVTVEPLHDYADNEHMSLVSIQALRRVFDDDNNEEPEAAEAEAGGFNPYQS
jgi:hypothetical protein